MRDGRAPTPVALVVLRTATSTTRIAFDGGQETREFDEQAIDEVGGQLWVGVTCRALGAVGAPRAQGHQQELELSVVKLTRALLVTMCGGLATSNEDDGSGFSSSSFEWVRP